METEKKSVASFMNRLYERGLTTACGGNVSMRCGNLMYITPSGTDKSCVLPDEIAVVDIERGENLTARLKLSIESEMHRRIYLERDDVGAVVHSHPLYASMFSALEEKIDTKLLAESYYLLLDVCKAPYALMGTSELAQNVAMTIRKCNAMLLENHGALTVGRSLLQAFERMEVLENAAKLTYMTGKSFTVSHISEENLEVIRKNFC